MATPVIVEAVRTSFGTEDGVFAGLRSEDLSIPLVESMSRVPMGENTHDVHPRMADRQDVDALGMGATGGVPTWVWPPSVSASDKVWPSSSDCPESAGRSDALGGPRRRFALSVPLPKRADGSSAPTVLDNPEWER